MLPYILLSTARIREVQVTVCAKLDRGHFRKDRVEITPFRPPLLRSPFRRCLFPCIISPWTVFPMTTWRIYCSRGTTGKPYRMRLPRHSSRSESVMSYIVSCLTPDGPVTYFIDRDFWLALSSFLRVSSDALFGDLYLASIPATACHSVFYRQVYRRWLFLSPRGRGDVFFCAG